MYAFVYILFLWVALLLSGVLHIIGAPDTVVRTTFLVISWIVPTCITIAMGIIEEIRYRSRDKEALIPNN